MTLKPNAPATPCNHTSVGVVVRDADGRILLFDRQTFPLAKACPAGHVDELDGVAVGAGRVEAAAYQAAAARELEEETGLVVPQDQLGQVLCLRTENPCRRNPVEGRGPDWHWWRVYRVVLPPGQTPVGNGRESKRMVWLRPDEVAALPDLEEVWRIILVRTGMIRENR